MLNRTKPTGFRQGGFTLIELMIVVVIVGILAAIALPNYQSNVRKGKRSEAMAALEELAQAMEKHYSMTYRYTDAASGGANTGAPDSNVYPHTSTPLETSEVAYNLRITAANANSYTLQAQPVGDQTKDPCGTLQVTHTGAKSSTGSGNGCW